MATTKRFTYEGLTAHQLRIGIAKLGLEGQIEAAVNDACSKALEAAQLDVLNAFGYQGEPSAKSVGTGTEKGKTGAREVRPAASTKSTGAPRKKATRSRKERVGKSGSGDSGDARAESRALQGRYIAAIRRVPKTKRARYKDLVAKEGRGAAIEQIDNDYPK